ncbi:hypothetical protein HanXRQr2_Chr09g0391581 [Helianthus annuus]|uniref:Uncharacterized protein n=1 Tax=Helianthus annuus TaxID=4232 RepID=A0A251TXR9_HELAN|nr:uncharacterized protein LOC110874684 [Helianthus annuus]KAF5791169.1 hypothetical protein HanXRQr2_Chr09g0391581 [Helianthus annuus]KAJ0534685.1 hypothetical protein HanIR_Chr09g0422461 [Helianthus annuus]KAJ0542674.1 hypothetical protein HanHA89_Chr09g0342331 [Helianthus annuus]KAJ0893435.1 hypothetical protein HanPSC8_Chr09g0377551 [Helianthus annuus]
MLYFICFRVSSQLFAYILFFLFPFACRFLSFVLRFATSKVLLLGTKSMDELNIFKELEKDVERDLEEEIKDDIYRLALRLHRLYQHQKERHTSDSSEPHMKEQHAKNKILSELNINIRMENGTKIEIKETKDGIRSPRLTSANIKRAAAPAPQKKKFNWESTLRSEPLVKSDQYTKPKSDEKDVKKVAKSNSVLAQRMENIPTKKNPLKVGSRNKNIWAP